MKKQKTSSKKIIARNRRARFNYDISEKYIAGIVLTGQEVKSVKQGQISLKESFIRVERGEVWLLNAHITQWQHSSLKEYDPQHRRKLLLQKREIRELLAAQEGKSMTIVPVTVFLQNGLVKVEIGVGKGRKKYDKRAKIKEREMKQQVQQDLSRNKYF